MYLRDSLEERLLTNLNPQCLCVDWIFSLVMNCLNNVQIVFCSVCHYHRLCGPSWVAKPAAVRHIRLNLRQQEQMNYSKFSRQSLQKFIIELDVLQVLTIM